MKRWPKTTITVNTPLGDHAQNLSHVPPILILLKIKRREAPESLLDLVKTEGLRNLLPLYILEVSILMFKTINLKNTLQDQERLNQ